MTAVAPAPNPLEQWSRQYYHRPDVFVKDVLGRQPHEWQARLMLAIARGQALPLAERSLPDRQFSLRSGHRVGKSTVVGWIALWFLLTRWRVKVIITAPTAGQLFDALFAELKSSARALPADVLALLDIRTDSILLRSSPEDAFITATTSRAENPEALQGKHSDNVLLIADEASAVPEAVFEASQGSMAANQAIMILASNPTRSSGYFYETQTRLKSQWTTFHVNSETIPTVSRLWLEGMSLKYGASSDEYRIRVLGEFPRTDSDTIIPLWMVEESIGRDIRSSPSDLLVWGVDIARMGEDATAVVKRSQRAVTEVPLLWRNLDTAQISARLDTMYRAERNKPEEILVDVIGWGAGVVDRSRQLRLPVLGINSGTSTTITPSATFQEAGYRNLRAEMWFGMRDWFESCAVTMPETERGHPDHAVMERLVTELTSVKYGYTDTGKLLVESKKDLRARKVGSPDIADALALTFSGRSAVWAGEGRYRRRAEVRRERKGIV